MERTEKAKLRNKDHCEGNCGLRSYDMNSDNFCDVCQCSECCDCGKRLNIFGD